MGSKLTEERTRTPEATAAKCKPVWCVPKYGHDVRSQEVAQSILYDPMCSFRLPVMTRPYEDVWMLQKRKVMLAEIMHNNGVV
jgi:hypothetical protein